MSKLFQRIMLVTPELAEKWLSESNPHNRHVKPHIVTRYAKDMKAGRWVFTGDPIQFDYEGNLLNGQHRLSAIIESDTPQRVSVWEGLDPSVQDAMDAGSMRVAGEQLQIHGMNNGRVIAAVIRMVIKWNAGQFSSRDNASTSEVIEFYSKDSELLSLATHWALVCNKSVHIGRAALGAFAYRLFKLSEKYSDFTNREFVLDFLDKLSTGADLEKGDPILLLRETSARYRLNKIRRSELRDLYNLARTWNAYMSGEKLLKLQLPKNGINSDDLILRHAPKERFVDNGKSGEAQEGQ